MDKVNVLVSWSGDNYVAATGEYNGLVIVTADNIEELKNKFEGAFRLHVEGSVADGDDLPEYIRSGQYEFAYGKQASAILKELDGLVSRVALAKVTHISATQLGHYLQGKKTPRPETEAKILAGVRKIGNDILATVQ